MWVIFNSPTYSYNRTPQKGVYGSQSQNNSSAITFSFPFRDHHHIWEEGENTKEPCCWLTPWAQRNNTFPRTNPANRHLFLFGTEAVIVVGEEIHRPNSQETVLQIFLCDIQAKAWTVSLQEDHFTAQAVTHKKDKILNTQTQVNFYIVLNVKSLTCWSCQNDCKWLAIPSIQVEIGYFRQKESSTAQGGGKNTNSTVQNRQKSKHSNS